MFGLGIWEILIIGVGALIFIGPEQMPGAARKAARWLGDMRRTADGFRAELMSDKIIDVEPETGGVSRGHPLQMDVSAQSASEDESSASVEQDQVAPEEPEADTTSTTEMS